MHKKVSNRLKNLFPPKREKGKAKSADHGTTLSGSARTGLAVSIADGQQAIIFNTASTSAASQVHSMPLSLSLAPGDPTYRPGTAPPLNQLADQNPSDHSKSSTVATVSDTLNVDLGDGNASNQPSAPIIPANAITGEAGNTLVHTLGPDLDKHTQIAFHQPGFVPAKLLIPDHPATPPIMSILEGATENIQGNSTLVRLPGDQPFTKTQISLKHLKNTLLRRGIAFLRIIGVVAGVPAVDACLEKEMAEKETVGGYCSILARSIKALMEAEGSRIPDTMNSSLMNIRSELAQMATEDISDIKDAAWRITNHLQIFLLKNIVTSSNVFGKMEEQLSDIQGKLDISHIQRQAVLDLPYANAAYDDYTSKEHRRASCFEGTRKELLKEVIDWLSESETNIYVLYGLAGIGKSTIAQTVAEKADKIGLLGGSFFFSRDEANRRTAELFFTTIAFQLCAYDSEFAEAIENVLVTEKGKGATRKGPLEQLDVLILGPLKNLTPRKVVIVVDALDECDDDDGPTVLTGLNKLVRGLPSFKVVLTTRPQQHIEFLVHGLDPHKVFHLHTIDDNVVDSDLRLYLKHHLSLEVVQARLRDPTEQWSADDEEIESLVKAAGRLFIIASTSVLFVLDIDTSDPEYRMKQLLAAIAQDRAPFKALNHFYTVILRSALPKDSDPHAVARYQTVIGTIILILTPLSIDALANLTGFKSRNIRRVLAKLKPVILIDLSSDTPRVYHKSFPDFIQDPVHCVAKDLRIDSRIHHTHLAIHCLRSLNRHLKQNIMDIGDPARFLSNNEALEKQGLTECHVQEKIPPELQYACLYFATHIESANVEDSELVEELERVVHEHLLNLLEALSWIGKLDSVHRPLLVVEKLLKSSSSDLGQVVTDTLRFIGKFYEDIKKSALYTYRSALPFTPTDTSLYKRYTKQLMFCQVQGGPEMWDECIASLQSSNLINHIMFSRNSTLFAFYGHVTSLQIHDAATGIPLGRIDGKKFAIANDFSKAAAFDDGSITLYNVKGVTPVATIKPSASVCSLALSPDGSRLAAALESGEVVLWETDRKCKRIKSFDGYRQRSPIAFSANGSRISYAHSDEVIKLIDGTSGRIVADLSFRTLRPWSHLSSIFSGDGSRLACLGDHKFLKVWNSQDGMLIGAAEEVGRAMAIATDGSLLATGNFILKLWSGNDLSLLETVDLDFEIWSLAISQDGLLGIASEWNNLVALYDISSHAFIARVPSQSPITLAFSPDSTRLATGSYDHMQLWDIPSIRAPGSYTGSQQQSNLVYKLAFSPDCSRLASAHKDGTIKLWNTSDMTQPIITHKDHLTTATILSFSIDGEQFASWSEEGRAWLWNGKDGLPHGILECSGELTEVALSSSMLAAATKAGITLWDLQARVITATLDQQDTCLLAISHHNSLLAAVTDINQLQIKNILTIWDTGTCTPVITHNLSNGKAWNMRFLPDDSLLSVQCLVTRASVFSHFQLSNTHDGKTSKVSEIQYTNQLDLFPSWKGIPVWINSNELYGQFPHEVEDRPLLRCPFPLASSATGSSMIALGCGDGRIVLIKVV